MASQYVLYRPEVETLLEDEQQIIDDIIASMTRLSGRTHEKYGHQVRVSHGKSHGLAVGELTVADNLPEHLAQSLFANGGATYPIIARLANVPGEIVSDAVNTQRGFAFKILGVEGEKIAGHEGQTTQDFVLDTGSYFPMADAKAFLMQHRMIEHAPQIPTVVKEAVSAVSRVTNEALNKLGADSAKLDFFGDSRIHPLAEAYFSQAPLRYGNYIAKLAVTPVSAKQKELAEKNVEVDSYNDSNALRTATVGYLRENDAEFDVQIQLCTDLEKMPVENANIDWKQEDSPYLTVARIRLPKQEAYSEARQKYVEALSFSPAHSLAAFRPLGSIMRVRLQAYPTMSRIRREGNHEPMAEPVSINEVPA
ncbi:catalase family protein [Mucilaginibacter robiniae]|uniref:Catalase family protein n=1 Tax=Mucilaginibacter robiniae TaxID=2728022 RepID=A0A7L5E714_9SPHI|nr:catalase family protein [Mucilaginibacter robiniae]QJD96633.1 catalase family protein [Mucilaginibacter robiniae]